MWASSWQNLRTRVRPPRAPESSLRCSAPKSAHRRGSSRHERTRCSNMRLKHKKPKSGPAKTSSCRDVCENIQLQGRVHVLVFTSEQDSSWASGRRSESPPMSQWTCSCCSAPSGPSAPTMQCCTESGSRPLWSLAFGTRSVWGQEGRMCATMSTGAGQAVTAGSLWKQQRDPEGRHEVVNHHEQNSRWQSELTFQCLLTKRINLIKPRKQTR